VPSKKVADSVAHLKAKDLLVVQPGMEVEIDLQFNGGADETSAAKKTIEERLIKNGMKIVADSKVKLVGLSQLGEAARVRFRCVGRRGNDVQEREITKQTLRLGYVLNGQAIWEYQSSTSAPGMLNLQEGENIDQALQRIMKQQEDSLPKRFLSAWIPAY